MEVKLFSEDEISHIYTSKVVKSAEYFNKYFKVPYEQLPPNYSWWYCHDFPRVWILLDFKEWITKYNLIEGSVLGYTSTIDPELDYLNYQTKICLPYPEYDLHKPLPDKNKYDLFVFNQTLEHLYNPLLAVSNVYAAIKPGGYVFTSVPVITIPHGSHNVPVHFAGFTPLGLCMLFMSVGFEVCESGQWGNHEYITKLFGTQSFKSFEDLKKDNCVSNEPNNECQTWILVRKPLA